MNKIVHNSMKQTGSMPNVPKQESYIVDDLSDTAQDPIDERLLAFTSGTPEPEEVVNTQKTEFEFPKKSMSKALEKLIFIGRLSKEVKIGGVSFELSSLTNRENNDLVNTMYNFSGDKVRSILAARIVTLAHAVKKIDDVPLEEIDIPGDFKNEFHKKMSIIDNLQFSVVEKLYEAYEELLEEKDEAVEAQEELKNS